MIHSDRTQPFNINVRGLLCVTSQRCYGVKTVLHILSRR